MRTTYGAIVADKPEGMLRPFKINGLVGLDVETGDGRLLKSEGAGVRTLPRTVFGGFNEGNPHGNNVVIGRLDAVEFDPDNNTATGWGWLLDNEDGQRAALYASTGALRHNSIHMTEVEVELKWKSDDPEDPDFWNYTFIFHKWKVASATMLAIPAFAESSFELTAAMKQAVWDNPEPVEITGHPEITFDVKFPEPAREEIVADGSPRPPWDYFHAPETSEPTPITVGEMDANGFVPISGHLARWNVCHDGVEARCIVAPHDPTEYASFNCSTVLTDRGRVLTGPIFFKGGHPDTPLGNNDVAKAYGGIENAWGDVRVTAGLHGPWISGVVRPSMTDDAIYAARASRISGHWAPDGRLKAIVSCNVPGFDVPASRVYTDEEGNVLELVASFVPDCAPSPDATEPPITHAVTTGTGEVVAVIEERPIDVPAEVERARMLALLDLYDDATV